MAVRRCATLVFVGQAWAAASAPAVRAETLAEAIAMTYQSNPTLQGQRAQQRALDETYVSARSGLRPTAAVAAATEYERADFGAGGGAGATPSGAFFVSPGPGHFDANSGGAQLTLSQPIYTGGRTDAAVRAAEANILAGRETLRLTETSVLQSVIQAYEDVRRDQAIVVIRRTNLSVLDSQLDETRTKFQVGQVTRTDTAQGGGAIGRSAGAPDLRPGSTAD